MEYKREAFSAEIELKADGDEGTFTGLASTFGNMDLTRDIIEPGAFAKSLKKRPARRIKMLFGHNVDEPIGVFKAVEEKKEGLFVEGKLILDVQRAKETHALMREKALDAMSIGFRTVVDEFDSDKRVRTLKEIELFEISIVVFPANERARIRTVKEAFQSGDTPTKRELEHCLRDVCGFSGSDAKAFIAKGYDGLPLRGDATDEDLREIADALRGM